MSMSQATIEAYARANSKVKQLYCIELRNPNINGAAILRLVDHHVDVEITLEANAPFGAGQTAIFVPRAMAILQPKQSDEPNSPYTFTLDAVDAELQSGFYNARQGGHPLYCTVRAVAYDVIAEAPIDNAAWVLNLEAQTVINGNQVVLTLGYLHASDEPYPNKLYNPRTHGGLYT